jgi:hypothetical protein
VKEASKQFFFEKKNQKTFAPLRACAKSLVALCSFFVHEKADASS